MVDFEGRPIAAPADVIGEAHPQPGIFAWVPCRRDRFRLLGVTQPAQGHPGMRQPQARTRPPSRPNDVGRDAELAAANMPGRPTQRRGGVLGQSPALPVDGSNRYTLRPSGPVGWEHGGMRDAVPPVDLASLAAGEERAGALWRLDGEDLQANLVRLGVGDRIQPHRNHEVDVLVVVVSGRSARPVAVRAEAAAVANAACPNMGRRWNSLTSELLPVSCNAHELGRSP